MKRTEIAALFSAPPAEKTAAAVSGWVRTSRESKNVGFIELNDGSCFNNLQIVVNAGLDNFKELANLPVGTAVSFEGDIVPTPGAKQPFELAAAAGRVIGSCDADYPLQKKRHTLEFLRTIPHLRPRANTYNAVFRVRSEAAFALHSFFHENGFVYVHTPLITGSDCEGAGEMFRVTTLDMADPPRNEDGSVDYTKDFFRRPTHLTVSGQLEGVSFAMAFGKIYTFGPTFRAENSYTPRHAAEFWMIEPEMAFTDLAGYMDTAEAMIKYVVAHLLRACPKELAFFNDYFDKTLIDRLNHLVGSEFGRITYTEAVRLLEPMNDSFEYKVSWGADLQTEHERALTEKIFKKPVFVTDYPKEIKSFYMRLNDDGKTVAAADMLVPGVGEMIGGSQREERTELLLRRIDELGLDRADYDWYIDLRRFGGVPHAGYGLGFERLIMYVTGMSNIRDVLPYPRTAGGF